MTRAVGDLSAFLADHWLALTAVAAFATAWLCISTSYAKQPSRNATRGDRALTVIQEHKAALKTLPVRDTLAPVRTGALLFKHHAPNTHDRA